MKTTFLFISIFFITLAKNAQEQKVKIVPDSLFYKPLSTEVFQVSTYCSYSVCGIDVGWVSADYSLPFKVYEFHSKDENWIDTQSIYNSIRSKVPGITISTSANLNAIPNIRMRGDDNTLVIVDGIRYDSSILNTLNPADIESVKVSNSPAAQNYFINQ